MKTQNSAHRATIRSIPIAAAAVLAIALSGCTTSSSDSSASSVALDCGSATGTPATGSPIKLGALSVDAPGIVYTASTDAASAYFDCVNDNGGINGHPIDYTVYHDALDPAPSTALATQLVEQDGVLGIVGGASVMDCLANQQYYASKGFYLVGMALPDGCFAQTNYSPVNAAGQTIIPAAQLLVKQGVKKIVLVSNAAPGIEVSGQMMAQFGQSVGVETEQIVENVPLSDANGLAVRLVQEAGPDGGVVLNLGTGDPQLLAAIEAQGLIDQVKWGSDSSILLDSTAAGLSSAWNDKLSVASDFALSSTDAPDIDQFKAVLAKYSPNTSKDATSISGYLAAQMTTEALLALPDDQLTVTGVNDAITGIKGFTSDFLCQPFSYGSGDHHMSNNSVREVTVRDGAWVETSGDCFDITAVPLNYLEQIRASL